MKQIKCKPESGSLLAPGERVRAWQSAGFGRSRMVQMDIHSVNVGNDGDTGTGIAYVEGLGTWTVTFEAWEGRDHILITLEEYIEEEE